MFNGSSKRGVVIRDIHSNLIEEAILILKSDPECRNGKEKSDIQKSRKKSNDFLLKEAEFIINNYVRENKLSLTGREPVKRISPPTNKNLVSTVINSLLIGSIALLIFLVSKMF